MRTVRVVAIHSSCLCRENCAIHTTARLTRPAPAGARAGAARGRGDGARGARGARRCVETAEPRCDRGSWPSGTRTHVLWRCRVLLRPYPSPTPAPTHPLRCHLLQPTSHPRLRLRAVRKVPTVVKAVVELSLSLLARVEDDADWAQGCVLAARHAGFEMVDLSCGGHFCVRTRRPLPQPQTRPPASTPTTAVPSRPQRRRPPVPGRRRGR